MRMKKIAYSKSQVKKFIEELFPEVDWSPVISQLPEIIWRARWNELAKEVGLPYSANYIRKLDMQGIGPGAYSKEGTYVS